MGTVYLIFGHTPSFAKQRTSWAVTPRALIGAAAAGRCHACPAKLPSCWKKLTYSKNATNSADLRMDIACSIHLFFIYMCSSFLPHTHTLYSVCVCLMIYYYYSLIIINTAIQWISLKTSQNQVLISEAPPRLHPTKAHSPRPNARATHMAEHKEPSALVAFKGHHWWFQIRIISDLFSWALGMSRRSAAPNATERNHS